jgi:hypothetical protein
MTSSLARLFAFVAASGLAHASVALVRVDRERPRQDGAESIQVVDLDLVVDDGQSAPRERETEREEPQHEPKRARRPAQRAPDRVSESELLVPAPKVPRPAPAPAPAPARVDLSPLAAARSVVDVRAAPAARAAPRAGDDRERGVTLDGMLREAAAARPELTRRDDPELAPRDGGYVFEGPEFDATIDGDGTVHFSDRYAVVQLTPLPTMLPDGTFVTVFLRVSFDLTAWAEAMHGNDPYRSERRWFLERTAELRERLAREAFARTLARADRELKRDLARIWEGELGADERARRTFELWDQMAEDEVGALGRRQIEAHVREHCAEPAACALDAPALERLNAGRRSRARFAPFTPVTP